MSSSHIRRKRLKLLSQDPHCYWCQCEVFEPGQPGMNKNNRATIDHLYGQGNGPRPKPGDPGIPHGTRTLVLSCQKCNTARSKHQEPKINKIEKWCLSGSFPRKIRLLAPIIVRLYKLGLFRSKNLGRNRRGKKYEPKLREPSKENIERRSR